MSASSGDSRDLESPGSCFGKIDRYRWQGQGQRQSRGRAEAEQRQRQRQGQADYNQFVGERP